MEQEHHAGCELREKTGDKCTCTQPGNVAHCPKCGTKTWHIDGVCEWADGHKE